MANPSQNGTEPISPPPRPPAAAPISSAPPAPQVQVTVNQAPAPAVRGDGSAAPPRESPEAKPGESKEAKPGEPKTPESNDAKPEESKDAKPAAPKREGSFTERVPENVAAMLAYLFAWPGGLVLLLADKRPFVRYHAAQSVVIFATLSLVLLVLSSFLLGALLPHYGGFLLIVRRLVELTWLVAAVVLTLKAAAGERYRVPYAASQADRAAASK